LIRSASKVRTPEKNRPALIPHLALQRGGFKTLTKLKISRSFFPVVPLGGSSSLLALLLLANYGWNCAPDCNATGSWLRTWVFPTVTGTFYAALRDSRLGPLLGFNAFAGTVAVLWILTVASFFAVNKSAVASAAFGFGVLAAYELGVYFLDPEWWTARFSNFQYSYLPWVTNEDVFLLASLLFVLSAIFLTRRLKA
jgi:hypothetical protein